ncbi:hypothetical protein LY13_000400 [Prauserella aidingensis]|uniref:Ig-like domain-containing protein n=1 Tax=Prauserella aidingensis TaxID=387890 RepID=UPI0020A38CB9|nr:Ig-like domain-containing protein [Prauserella aidingensis]MCP2251669.1 hypothetical protein [Prauserella aidingensis]
MGGPGWTTSFGIGGMVPCARATLTGQIINDTDVPTAVTYTGAEATGTIAPFLVLGLEDWEDVVLQPGEATGIFTFTVEMPCETGNEAQGTSGQVRWNWNVVADTPPPPEFKAVDDAAITSSGTPIDIAVLDNDGNVPEGGRVEVTPGDPAGGEWAVGDDGTVTFTPSDTFSGAAHATYTVFDADGNEVGGAGITVEVEPPEPEPTTTPQPTPGPTTTPGPTSTDAPPPTTQQPTTSSPETTTVQQVAPPVATTTDDEPGPLAATFFSRRRER